MKSAIIGCICVLTVLAAGCMRRDHDKWPPHDQPATVSPSAADSGKRVIVFAPIAAGPLAADYAEARLQFAFDLASRIDLLTKDYDGQAGEELPDSDAQDWSRGPVPATAGAYLTVLTRVLEIKRNQGVADMHERQGTILATVEMKAVDGSGQVVFLKKAVGQASGSGSAKLMSDSSKPESLAAWDACSTAVGALIKYTSQSNDVAVPASGSFIVVDVDSDPTRADIVVDGSFLGTTPMKLQLPQKVVTVRIERQGYQPWQRQLTPSKDMRIQPVLAKLGDATPRTSGSSTSPLTPAPMPQVTPGGDADHSEPKPKRAEPMDDTMAPPTPDTLVVPDGK
ncbi:MAG: PEGA domain-containing protein [Planctomycetes bacterium]|nr:PEGA domain-containing protein [Planctomycetota bacterium]